jgi:hypothetical protein
MTTLSTRHTGPLLALLLSACLAVWIHAHGGFRSDDCADPAALLEPGWIEGLELSEAPYGKAWPWLLHDAGGSVGTEASGILQVGFRVLRSFELQRLYEAPVLLLPAASDFVGVQPTLEWIGSDGGDLPVHSVFFQESGLARIGAYMFVYESRPVANPSLALLSSLLRRVVTGRRPLTLFTVSVTFSRAHRAAAEALADECLTSAWEYYRSVCRN